MNRIEPTVGRIVHLFNSAGQGPMAAIVTDVSTYLGEGCITVTYFPPGSAPVSEYVALVQDGEPKPHGEAPYAEWMGYQKGQAAKATDSTAPHVERMKLELQELSERVQRLSAFMNDPEKFSTLSHLQQQLMHEQVHAMQLYLKALGGRIALS